jgi:hypothetical protein
MSRVATAAVRADPPDGLSDVPTRLQLTPGGVSATVGSLRATLRLRREASSVVRSAWASARAAGRLNPRASVVLWIVATVAGVTLVGFADRVAAGLLNGSRPAPAELVTTACLGTVFALAAGTSAAVVQLIHARRHLLVARLPEDPPATRAVAEDDLARLASVWTLAAHLAVVGAVVTALARSGASVAFAVTGLVPCVVVVLAARLDRIAGRSFWQHTVTGRVRLTLLTASSAPAMLAGGVWLGALRHNEALAVGLGLFVLARAGRSMRHAFRGLYTWGVDPSALAVFVPVVEA